MAQSCRTQKHSLPPPFEPQNSVNVRSASFQPPITRKTLRELDSEILFSDLLLRHDLNFDPKIQYRPTTHGLRGELREKEAHEYWSAITVEIAEWFLDQGSECSCCTTARSPLNEDHRRRVAMQRLPSLFDTVSEILKSLLPESERSNIDARLDIELMIQQLENGVFDLSELSQWLGDLLCRHCTSERKRTVAKMTKIIHSGLQNANVADLSAGLMQLFAILEAMKLDCANQDIKNLRPVMVDNTVTFEQQDFLQRIARGWDISRARTWFVENRQGKHLSSEMMILGQAVVKMIVSNCSILPPTFTLDYIRLRTLQRRFESLNYQAACRWTFEQLLVSMESQASIPQSTYDQLFARVSAIVLNEEQTCFPLQQTKNVALEIVRAAYHHRNISSLPSIKDLRSAKSKLEYACNATSAVHEELQAYLSEDLQVKVDEEIQAIKDFSPMQISNRYVPEDSTHLRPSPMTEKMQTRQLAQQMGHIIVLHWRVWGPILYEQPDVPGEI